MKKVRINRKKWLRLDCTTPWGITGLWNKELNAGCCLGHACKQISHLSEDRLNNIGMPCSIFFKESFFTKKAENGLVLNKSFVNKAASINDNYTLSDAEKEKKLIALFRKNGIKLEFYGKGLPSLEQ